MIRRMLFAAVAMLVLGGLASKAGAQDRAFGRTWGGKFAPTEVCSPVVPCEPGGGPPTPVPTGIVVEPCPTPGPTPTHGGGKPTPTPKKTILPSLPIQTGSTTGPAGTAIAPVVFLPFLVPLLTFAIGRRLKLERPGRPTWRRGRRS